MTTTQATSARLATRVPSTRVLRLVNPFVSAILRSPLHGLLSRSTLLLTLTGRKSGKQFTFPVGYTRVGETFSIYSGHGWWKNLRGGAPVVVYFRGRRRTGRAEVIDDPEIVLAEVEHLIAVYGPKAAGRRVGLVLEPNHLPSRDELARAMQGHVVVHLTLES